MKPKIIFVHGNGGGTGHDNWFPWCVRELKHHGVQSIAPDFPDPQFARSTYWLPFLKDELKADEHTILIGHSSGAVAAMRYAEHNKIMGSILVGASYTELGDESEKISGYFGSPWDWRSIRSNQKWIIQYASIDDPYIPIKEQRIISKMLQTEYYEYSDRGHFGEDISMVIFPDLIEKLLSKLKAVTF